ncbi:hypothetical protein GQR58_023807 [Nymphon striatum]|nr:hypothetical protein GQR58_023807 [Nymphon striatum]
MLITCVKSNDTTNTVEELKLTGILQPYLNCKIAPPGFLVPKYPIECFKDDIRQMRYFSTGRSIITTQRAFRTHFKIAPRGRVPGWQSIVSWVNNFMGEFCSGPTFRIPLGPHVTNTETLILEKILEGYDKRVRPVRNSSTPVTVNLGMTLTQIFDLVSSFQTNITPVFMYY